MRSRPLSRACRYGRRLRYWLSGFAWFGIFALLCAGAGVVLALTDRPVRLVAAVGAAAVVLAILSTKETTQ